MPTVVILREVAVSMAECQGVMDSATARGMTKLEFYGYSGNDEVGVPLLLPGMAKLGFRCYCREWRGSAATAGMTGGARNANGRHTARSRSIHGGVPGGHGFRDCARNDEVGVLRLLREWRSWGSAATAGNGEVLLLPPG